ncbi:helix-turn-helix transcriptional regulator [Muricauda sp. CAU 1633]|uniref:helix-turn-helix domain-containing protein n=1 Tax=Allomuricauda sp. CAU 1633 TaxID=2816036 RepID=UPI001A8DC87F|nr:AraC family transcriptional regulator [Muricauda sp. CAU 1633]MBO0321907.1 helix-turn-helix transcriptional regulator [Muricauda sp. CAU 1633]
MINFYQTLKALDIYKKVIVRDLLCVEYKCFLEDTTFKFWTEVGCLVFCTSGKKIYSSKNQDLTVTKGATFFMKKGAYTGESFFEEDYCALMLFLPESYVNHFLTKYDYIKVNDQGNSQVLDSSENLIALPQDSTLEAFFFTILNYFANMLVINKELLEVKFDELLLNLFTQPEYTSLSTYLLQLVGDERIGIRQVMEENYASSLKLPEYAELCNMSLSTFKREFPKVYKTSPGRWLLNRKLQLSKKLLGNSNLHINEIAFRCGFENTSHFIRTFKKYQDTTPSKYRLLLN